MYNSQYGFGIKEVIQVSKWPDFFRFQVNLPILIDGVINTILYEKSTIKVLMKMQFFEKNCEN